MQSGKGGKLGRGKNTIVLNLRSNSSCEMNIKLINQIESTQKLLQ
jgi:hypothetical protein